MPLSTAGDIVVEYVASTVDEANEKGNEIKKEVSIPYYVYTVNGSFKDSILGNKNVIELESGNVTIEGFTNSVPLGTKYKHTPPEILIKNGKVYKIKTVHTGPLTLPLEGVIVEGPYSAINVEYEEFPAENLEIRYEDTEGNSLKESKLFENIAGSQDAQEFRDNEITKDDIVYNYFKEVVTKEGDKTVITYVYKVNSKEIYEVSHIDENGNPLKEKEQFEDLDGAKNAKKDTIVVDGKTYVFKSEETSEKDSEGVTKVTYKYELQKENVTMEDGDKNKDKDNGKNNDDKDNKKVEKVNKSSEKSPNTGDERSMLEIAVVFVMSMITMLMMLFRRKRDN